MLHWAARRNTNKRHERKYLHSSEEMKKKKEFRSIHADVYDGSLGENGNTFDSVGKNEITCVHFAKNEHQIIHPVFTMNL